MEDKRAANMCTQNEAIVNAEVLKAPPLNLLLVALKLTKKHMILHLDAVLDESVCGQ